MRTQTDVEVVNEERFEPWCELEPESDPQPETNAGVEVRFRPGSRLAAEYALGPRSEWEAELARVAVAPALVLLASGVVLDIVPWARPSFVGLLAAVVVTASLARAIGRFAPRALAHVRRVPLALVALAAGGLGACVGAASLGTLVLLSPWLLHGRAYVVAGASFGLAYWTLLMVPFLSVRLGRAPRSLLSVTQVGAGLVAGAYAVWNASALG